jgi:UDPglucose 6-dehydrogenase
MIDDICKDCNLSSNKIMKMIGLDKRVSPKYMTPGMPYGGTCFPRDVLAMQAFINDLKSSYYISSAIDSANNTRADLLANRIEAKGKGKEVLFIGASFKPGTSVIEGSSAIKIAEILVNFKNINVSFYDTEEAIKNLKKEYGDKFKASYILEEVIKDEMVIVLAHPYTDYVFYKKIKKLSNFSTIINIWEKV